jgi:hypothetical protein
LYAILLEVSGRGRLKDDMGGDEYSSGIRHDIYDNDIDIIIDEEIKLDEVEEAGGAKYIINGPMPFIELKAGIICGHDHEFQVNMRIILEPSFHL